MRLTRGFMRSLVLLETPDEVAIRIAYALDSPLDMLRLSIACKRFRLRTITGSRMDSGSGSEQGGMPELWSIVEAAHARVRNPRISIAEPSCPTWRRRDAGSLLVLPLSGTGYHTGRTRCARWV